MYVFVVTLTSGRLGLCHVYTDDMLIFSHPHLNATTPILFVHLLIYSLPESKNFSYDEAWYGICVDDVTCAWSPGNALTKADGGITDGAQCPPTYWKEDLPGRENICSQSQTMTYIVLHPLKKVT